MAGKTASSDFPTTTDAYDTNHSGGSYYDVFVSKLNSDLTSLLDSTLLGGLKDDIAQSMTIDTSGNIYVAGKTASSDFPTTTGAYDTNHSGGSYYDAFVSKLSNNLGNLLSSTFLGSLEDNDAFSDLSIAIDTSGNVYVAGATESSDFPTTAGAYDTAYSGPGYNIFISKLNNNLGILLASTFLGGRGGFLSRYDSIELDSSGNVYVAGPTASSGFPTTTGAYDTSINGSYDIFISKFDSSLSASSATPTPSPILNTQPVTLASDLAGPNLLTIDQHNVYWTESIYNSSGWKVTIKKVPLDGGDITAIATQTVGSGGSGGTGIAVDDTSIYWGVNPGYGSGNIYKIQKTGGTIKNLASANQPHDIDIDDTYVYWAESNGGTYGSNAIRKVPIDGGTVRWTGLSRPFTNNI